MAEQGTHQYKSIITDRDRECLGCRIVSGVGLIGAGCYVNYHAKQNRQSRAYIPMFFISCILGVAGIARLTDAWHTPKSTTNPAMIVSSTDKV